MTEHTHIMENSMKKNVYRYTHTYIDTHTDIYTTESLAAHLKLTHC